MLLILNRSYFQSNRIISIKKEWQVVFQIFDLGKEKNIDTSGAFPKNH
jgi:hypothetical protein